MAPFILTRDKLQAQVIGAGYPSVPTYTLEEFYEQRYKDVQPPSANGYVQLYLRQMTGRKGVVCPNFERRRCLSLETCLQVNIPVPFHPQLQ